MEPLEDKLFVGENDLIEINDVNGETKVLKEVALTKIGKDVFEGTYILNDNWMRKIYSQQPYAPPEELSEPQLKLINNWVKKRKMVGRQVNFSRLRQQTPVDTILGTLSMSDLDYGRLMRYGKCYKEASLTDRIAEVPEVSMCLKHKIQSESKICEFVMKKMQNLPEEDEKLYRQLLQDEDFRQKLDDQIVIYFKKIHSIS